MDSWWQKSIFPDPVLCTIRILKHPRLEADRLYSAERQHDGAYIVEQEGSIEVVWKWEATMLNGDYEEEE
jgi:hypothetical protein